jgi:hypothetical protein
MLDNIDVDDFQDSFGLMYELVYLNKLNLEDLDFLNLVLEEYFQSILANIRASKTDPDTYAFNNKESGRV